MDNLHPEDLRLLPMEAIRLLADLYNMIEQGGNWPEALQHARAAMLSKNELRTMDPLEYRILLITP
eukprot:8333668-Karenia_brevis.AAC.1